MERHAGLLGQGWQELVDSQLTKPPEGFSSGAGSRHQVGCVKATPCARARLCHWGRVVPLRRPDSAPSVPQVAEHAGLAGQPGHRRRGAALLPRPRPQPPRGPELQPLAGRSAWGCCAGAGFSPLILGGLSPCGLFELCLKMNFSRSVSCSANRRH